MRARQYSTHMFIVGLGLVDIDIYIMSNHVTMNILFFDVRNYQLTIY